MTGPMMDATRERGEWLVACPVCQRAARISSTLHGLTITVCPAGHERAVPRVVAAATGRTKGGAPCVICDKPTPPVRPRDKARRTCSDACFSELLARRAERTHQRRKAA